MAASVFQPLTICSNPNYTCCGWASEGAAACCQNQSGGFSFDAADKDNWFENSFLAGSPSASSVTTATTSRAQETSLHTNTQSTARVVFCAKRPGSTDSTAIGVGVGVSLGVTALAALGTTFMYRRKYLQVRDNYHRHYINNEPVGLMEERVSETELKRNERISELPSQEISEVEAIASSS